MAGRGRRKAVRKRSATVTSNPGAPSRKKKKASVLEASPDNQSDQLDSDTLAPLDSDADHSDELTPPPKIKISRAQLNKAIANAGTATGVNLDNAIQHGVVKNAAVVPRTVAARADSELDNIFSTQNSSDEEEEDQLDSDSADSEIEDVMDVRYHVLHAGAITKLALSSDITAKAFLTEIGETMGIKRKALQLSYRLGSASKTSPFNHLSTRDEYESMVLEYISAVHSPSRKQQKGKKSKAVLHIDVKDLNKVSVKALKPSAKTSSVSKPTRKSAKKKPAIDTDSSSDSEDDGSEKPTTLPQRAAIVMKANACARCAGKSCVDYRGHHHTLSQNDISLWALAMSNGYRSATVPPRMITDIIEANILKEVKTTPQAAPIVTPPTNTYPQYPPYGGYPSHPFQPPYPYYPPPPTKQHSNDMIIPSSDGLAEEVKDRGYFPPLDVWLAGLDSSKRKETFILSSWLKFSKFVLE
ncbi:hypothetical protein FISHEDRAFT_68643 [Fistulina hepatica ATCC 64428]|uniref:Uncharacterized protein n=1 Tax=Fistulina hepatica ATCC 64428 TaxID=1128425 RepID=A0A0D7ASD0_9AGAR|nr:hypothetical protein FISHEDRAFT_68643 [Fistulina hepatica ATCC 64428]